MNNNVTMQARTGLLKTTTTTVELQNKTITETDVYRMRAIDATHILISEGVEIFDRECFCNYRTLKSINIPSSVKELRWGCLKECRSLQEISISPGVKIIEAMSFFQCLKLPSITLPDTVTKIGSEAFEDCISLQSVALSNNIKEIPFCCFNGCKSLKSIHIPEGVTYIGKRAFGFCKSLETVKLPDTLKVIEAQAFYKCDNLKAIEYKGKNIIDIIRQENESRYIELIKPQNNEKQTSSFLDIEVGDCINCYDEYSHDIDIHHVVVTSIEYDKEYATESNPDGKVCYVIDEPGWGDEYVGVVYESNFIDKDKEYKSFTAYNMANCATLLVKAKDIEDALRLAASYDKNGQWEILYNNSQPYSTDYIICENNINLDIDEDIELE